MVHASLSRLGWIVGSAQTVVGALLDVVGPDGTIVMPAHTGVSDPSRWQNPPVPEDWWPIIRDEWPAFDPSLTPTRAMGAVAECFRRLPDVLHSGHPAVPVIARGPQAATITASHPLEQSLGDESPIGRLYDLDARIVLIGVGHDNNTSLHLCEHRAEWPTKATRVDGAPLLVDGERRWVVYHDLDHDSDDFEALGAAFVAAGGAEQRAALGNGTIVTCSIRDSSTSARPGWPTTERPDAAMRQPSNSDRFAHRLQGEARQDSRAPSTMWTLRSQ